MDFAGDTTNFNDEVVVSGGEEGRLTAFDANHRLQIFGGGSLSGQAITITGNNKAANNSCTARFGLSSSKMRFTGQDISPSNGSEPLTFSYNDIDITELRSEGISVPSAFLPDDIEVSFSETTPVVGV